MAFRTGCLICGEELRSASSPRPVACAGCGARQTSATTCTAGHFVCDRFHSLSANDLIERFCVDTTSSDPVALAAQILRSPALKMRGPEHHFLVPAVLLAAFYNHQGQPERKAAKIAAARSRAEEVKGGFCGQHGACGAALGCGITVSLIAQATPLSCDEWRLANLATAASLQELACKGGPRCCKRDTFLALSTATAFLRENLGVDLGSETSFRCSFHPLNQECLREGCPFYPKARG